MVTALEQGDLLTAVVLPEANGSSGSAYRKWGIVKDAVPVVGVAAFLALDDSGRCTDARFVVGGLDEGPQRSAAAERMLTGGCDPADPAALSDCANAAAEEIATSDDHRASADYKKQLIRQLGAEVLATASERARA
jgi:carbon-monoxide dehydrogenase medium subunit